MLQQIQMNIVTDAVYGVYPLGADVASIDGALVLQLPLSLVSETNAVIEFVGDFSDLKAACLNLIESEATEYRKLIAGNVDAAKLAEYADKARTAERILNNEPVAEASITEAKSEMVSLGLAADAASADVVIIAGIWRDVAAKLTAARTAVNAMIRSAKAAVNAAEDATALDTTMAGLKQQADALLAQIQGS